MLALLVFLVVEMPAPHRRDEIATLLWPEQPRENARHNLRQALTTLRRALADGTAYPHVVTEGDSVGFNPDGGARIDIVEFTHLLDTCAAHAHRDLATCLPCARRHEQALALYRGELCAGSALVESDDLDAWLQTHRERLNRRAMAAFTALADHHERAGRPQEARHVLERQLELDPWREPAHRALMRVLARMNERNAALRQYETCVRLLDEELGLEPESETTALYEQIRAGLATDGPATPPPAPVAHPAERVAALTPLIGREHEVRQLGDLLTLAECRILTLVGPGGIGKTRLALHLAQELGDGFPDGARIVPLTPVRDPELLAPAIAEALGAAHQGRGDPEHHLVGLLRDRALLLVLDSMEHLLEAGALLSHLLARAPDLKVLVTSRERLGLQSEWVFPVGGLTILPDDGATDDSGAVGLFLDRLRRVRPLLPVQEEERPAIHAICRMVEGMPLAIELAAAWASTLSIEGIAAEIEHGIDFLEIPLRDVPARHRSMRAVFDHSWDLLTPEEQHAFERLSLFRGGFSREAAEYVAGATLPILSSLVAKSVIRADQSDRYGMHDLLRQYGERKLAGHSRDELRARDRYARSFLGAVADREDALTGRQQTEALAYLTREIDNLRHAWHIALQLHLREPVNRAIHGLWLYFVIRGWMHEGEALFGDTVAAFTDAAAGDPPNVTVARALIRQGGFQSGLGHYEAGAASIRRGLATLRELNDQREVALGLNFLAAASHLMGQDDIEHGLLDESLALFRDVGDLWGEAYVLSDLGMLALARDDPERADTLCRRSQALFRQINDARGLAFAAQHLGIIAVAQGDVAGAARCHEEALALRRASEDQWGIATSLVHLGNVRRTAGDPEGARAMFMEALRVARAAWVLPVVLEVLVELAVLYAEQGQAEVAGEMLATVMHDAAAGRQLRERTERALSALEAELPEAQRVTLHERAAASSVDLLVRSLLP